MIRQERGIYIAECDKCGRAINTGLKSIQQAANYLSRTEGWDSWRKRGEAWRNFCPACVVDGDPDFDFDRIGVQFGKKHSFDE